MKVKLLLAALVVVAAPSIAMAMGCNGHDQEQITMSCPEGQAFDVETSSCITPTG